MLGRELMEQRRWPELGTRALATLDSRADESAPRLDVRLPALRQLAVARHGQDRGSKAIAVCREMFALGSQRLGGGLLDPTMARDLLAVLVHAMGEHDLVIATRIDALEHPHARGEGPRLVGRVFERTGFVRSRRTGSLRPSRR